MNDDSAIRLRHVSFNLVVVALSVMNMFMAVLMALPRLLVPGVAFTLNFLQSEKIETLNCRKTLLSLLIQFSVQTLKENSATSEKKAFI